MPLWSSVSKTSLLACCATLGLSLGGLAAGLFAADPIPADKRLPPEVVAYVSLPDLSACRARWGETLFGKLVQEPQFSTFLKEFDEPLAKVSDETLQKVGVSLWDILNIPQGEVTLAVMQSGSKPLAVVALLDFGENRETVQKLLEKATEAVENEGATRAEEDFEDTTIVTFTEKKSDDADGADAKGQGTPRSVAYFVKDTYLVAGSRVDALKAVISRWDGEQERTLADKPVYKYIMEACRGESERRPVMVWFLDPIGLIKGAVASAGPPSPQTAIALGFLPTLGLDKLRGLGGTYDLAAGEFDAVSRALLYMEPPATGVLKLLECRSQKLAPPKWVRARTPAYFSLNWNIEEAYNAASTLYATFAGPGALENLIDQLADAEGGPKIHIKKDLIDVLSGQLHIISDALPPENAEDTPTERILVALELKDETAMKKTLSALIQTPDFPLKPREFRGQTIYEGEAEEPGGAPAGFAIARQALLIASDISLLEDTLRDDADQETLADSADYQKLARLFPNETASIGFQKADAQVRMVYESLRSGKLTEALQSTGEKVPVDFSKLPPFEVIQKYLTPSASYMRQDEKGLFMMSFSLKGTQD